MALYTFGCNKNFELGLGETDKCDFASEPRIVAGLRNRTITAVSCGEQFTLALTLEGDVFAWGRGREGQLGLGSRDNVSTPTRIDALAHEVVTQIAAAWQHSLVVCASGRVYSFGQLHELSDKGAGGTGAQFGTSISLPGLGARRTQMLVEQSSLAYFSGGNDEEEAAVRELNFGSFRPKLELLPVQLPFFGSASGTTSPVTCVAGGYSFSVAVTADGAIYTFGVNEVGQLGHGHKFNSHLPVRVSALAHEHIVAVACGQQHVLALAQNGNVYSWGLGTFGQLGTNSLRNATRPQLVGVTGDGVRCGAHFSCITRADAPPYLFGHAEWGQFAGTSQFEDWNAGMDAGAEEGAGRSRVGRAHAVPRVPEALKHMRIEAIACGTMHNLVLTRGHDDAPSVLAWGANRYGCLGVGGDRAFQLVPKELDAFATTPIALLAAGGRHTVAVARATSFALDFLPALADAATSDVVFVLAGGNARRLYAHAAMLRARLPGLERLLLFQTRFTREHGAGADAADADSGKRCVRLGAVQFQVLRALLIYVYTDQLQCPPHLFVPLARLAFQCGAARLSAQAWKRAELAGYASKRFARTSESSATGAAQRAAFERERDSSMAPSTFGRDVATLLGRDDADERDAESIARRNGDVTLLVDGHEVRAHRFVLTARSIYFKRLFEGGFSESRSASDELLLEGVSPATLRTLLLHLYTGESDSLLDADNLVDVLAGADMLLLDNLKARAENLLLEALDADNCAWLFATGAQFNAPKLRAASKKLLLQLRVTDSSDLSPELVQELQRECAITAS
jgi:alpha-tubulin suppressor-like RCC1 family protein